MTESEVLKYKVQKPEKSKSFLKDEFGLWVTTIIIWGPAYWLTYLIDIDKNFSSIEFGTVLIVLLLVTCICIAKLILIWKLPHLNTNVWSKDTNNSLSLVTRFINNQSLKWVRIFLQSLNCSMGVQCPARY